MRRALARCTGGLVAVTCLLPLTPATARGQSWTDWTARTLSIGTTNGSAAGTLDVGGSAVAVDFTGNVYAATQTACGVDYWAFNSAIYTSPANGVTERPAPCDIVSLVGGANNPATQTITFSRPVENPLLAILSLGQPSLPTTYAFSAPFELLNSGRGYFGGSAAGSLFAEPGNVLRGLEGHGLLRFEGTFTSISWTVPTAETWHGFTVGVAGPTQVVPEPSTVALLAGGLGILAGARRRRRA